MNAITRNTALIAVAAAGIAVLGTPAHAQEATYELPQPVVVIKSRADLLAEVLQARQAGTLEVTEGGYPRAAAFVVSKTRAEVAAEVRADAGASRALTAEPHGFDAPVAAGRAPQAPVLARVIR